MARVCVCVYVVGGGGFHSFGLFWLFIDPCCFGHLLSDDDFISFLETQRLRWLLCVCVCGGGGGGARLRSQVNT